jgi:hypothetical protein
MTAKTGACAVHGGPRLTERDRAMLAWIGRYGWVTSAQVARRWFTVTREGRASRRAYERLEVLRAMRLVERRRTNFDRAPHVLRLSGRGVTVAEIGLRKAHYVEAEMRHAIAEVDLMEALQRDHPSAKMRTEREIRSERVRERLGDGRSDGARRNGRGRIPDGEISLSGGTVVVAVELDLTAKRTKEFERILRAYEHERYDRIWWYVRPAVLHRLATLVKQRRADDFVDVRAWTGDAL